MAGPVSGTEPAPRLFTCHLPSVLIKSTMELMTTQPQFSDPRSQAPDRSRRRLPVIPASSAGTQQQPVRQAHGRTPSDCPPRATASPSRPSRRIPPSEPPTPVLQAVQNPPLHASPKNRQFSRARGPASTPQTAPN